VKLFVTGAGGFIGRNLLPRLTARGHAVTALLLPDEPGRGLGPARLVRGDITEPDGLVGMLADHDGVVHLAAAVGYGQRMEHCLRLNRDGTLHVAAAAVAAGARRFVHLSSVAVYGRAARGPICEDAPLRKTGDPYGDTKIDAEAIVRAHAARGELDLTVLRPTVVYGPGDDKFLPKLVANLRSGRARVVGSGAQRVDALHVDDLTRFIVDTIDDPRSVGRTYNLANPDNPAWRDFVAFLTRELGLPPPRGRVPYPLALATAAMLEVAGRVRGREPRLTRYAVRVVGRAYDYRPDRARSELGFAPRIPLEEGARRWLEAARQATREGPRV
jgi:nucleoside-diphosphate-sugar epimerase